MREQSFGEREAIKEHKMVIMKMEVTRKSVINEMIIDCLDYLQESDFTNDEITSEVIQNQIEQLHGEKIEIELIDKWLSK